MFTILKRVAAIQLKKQQTLIVQEDDGPSRNELLFDEYLQLEDSYVYDHDSDSISLRRSTLENKAKKGQ